MFNQRTERGTTVGDALSPFGGVWPVDFDPAASPARVWTNSIVAALRRMRDRLAARKGRRELMALDERMLKDIGLSRCELFAMDIGADSPRAQR